MAVDETIRHSAVNDESLITLPMSQSGLTGFDQQQAVAYMGLNMARA